MLLSSECHIWLMFKGFPAVQNYASTTMDRCLIYRQGQAVLWWFCTGMTCRPFLGGVAESLVSLWSDVYYVVVEEAPPAVLLLSSGTGSRNYHQLLSKRPPPPPSRTALHEVITWHVFPADYVFPCEKEPFVFIYSWQVQNAVEFAAFHWNILVLLCLLKMQKSGKAFWLFSSHFTRAVVRLTRIRVC